MLSEGARAAQGADPPEAPARLPAQPTARSFLLKELEIISLCKERNFASLPTGAGVPSRGEPKELRNNFPALTRVQPIPALDLILLFYFFPSLPAE